MLRAFMVMMLVLCALCGGYLLVFAPSFSMPAHGNLPGRQFGPDAARVLGAALAVIAVLATIFLRHLTKSLPAAGQKIYFALIVLALVLANLALNMAKPG